MIFKDRKITVLGFGVEGESTVRFLLGKGADITVLDERKKAVDLGGKLKGLEEAGVKCVFGKLSGLERYDILVVSPGIRFDRTEIEAARKTGAEITTATNVFMDSVPCLTIGVTGTKGKGTTSALITEFLKKDGRNAYLGGNIGIPPLDFLDQLTEDSIAVLELSSFQIFNMVKSPDIAVILMTTSEHLDYHKDTDEYVMAKANLVRYQKRGDSVIYNVDYDNSRKIVRSAKLDKSGRFEVSTQQKVPKGSYVENDAVYFSDGKTTDKIIDCERIFIPGKHNWENVCAAVAAAKILQVKTETIVHVLENFQGLPHRLELVRDINGVKYYDDSFSTTPETAVAAIKAFREPKVLILGGSSKNSDFTELGKVISEDNSVRGIIGVGLEWKRIKSEIKMSKIKSNQKLKAQIIEGCNNMKEIVEAAKGMAKAGDVVILSPACASFDMFKNYKDRGDQFKQSVNALQ